MSEAFYSHARLYDLMFPGGGPAVDSYRAGANRQAGRVLELGCGTGHKLIPIASDRHPCVGLDFSSDMLAEARRKGERAPCSGGMGAGRHAGLRSGPHIRLRVHHGQFPAASA
jgi:SAM-dependent methyltransferase